MELETKQLILAIKTIADEKNLPEEDVHSIVEEAIVAAWKRDNDVMSQEFRAKGSLNTNKGTITVTVTKAVVDEVEDTDTEVSLEDAKKLRKDAKVGEDVDQKHMPEKFGRVAAQTAKQVILQQLREFEREVVLAEYTDKIGTVINGVVSRVEAKIVRVDLGKAQGIMPISEQIPGEHYSMGSRIKVYLRDVESTGRGPQLILSRANDEFIRFLFTQEVPEMENGAVEIKNVAREAGGRSKIAVASSVPGVDPVGTFVGGHGTRVQAVSGEINDIEKIDIVPFSETADEYIRSALAPAGIVKIDIDEEAKRATVYAPEDQLSIAIGRQGQNVRLASKLTGYELDIEKADGISDDGSGNKADKATDVDKEEKAEEPKKADKEEKADNNQKEEEMAVKGQDGKIRKVEDNRVRSKAQVEEDMLATIAAATDPDDTSVDEDSDNVTVVSDDE